MTDTEDGWSMAVRAISLSIEQSIPSSPEKDSLLRHLRMSRSPLDGIARDQEVLAVELAKTRGVASRLWAALRRYEPSYLETLSDIERSAFDSVVRRGRR